MGSPRMRLPDSGGEIGRSIRARTIAGIRREDSVEFICLPVRSQSRV